MSLAVLAAALAVARALTVPTAVQHESHAPRSVLFAPREVSGTAWAPDETIDYGVHRRGRGWDVMLHGTLFAQFIYEPPEFVHRTGGFSSTQASSENWGMLMARRSA